MKGMVIKTTERQDAGAEFNSDMYEIFEELSSETPERIEGFRVRVHEEIDVIGSKAKDIWRMHAFIDLLADACIRAAAFKEKSRQNDPCADPVPTAMSERITLRQADSITYAL